MPVSPRKARVACSISLILLLANCGGDSTGPGDNKPGISWSPDGTYVIGRSSEDPGLRLVRVNDGLAVSLRFPMATGCCHDYYQPDWR